jgi:L-threonylcarbamoyladenylate synthase
MTDLTEKAASIIKAGGTVVYPTETVYGLGASAWNEEAIRKIFQIKRRPLSKPVFLAVSNLQMLRAVAVIEDEDLAILKKLLPGPVSFLVRRNLALSPILTAGSSLVGIRIPDHELALHLINLTGPITSTSANLTGALPPTRVDEIEPSVVRAVDLILDGGKSRYAQPSTLVDLASRKILREGAGLDRVLEVLP